MRIAIAYNEPLPSRYDAFGEGLAVASVAESVHAIQHVMAARGHSVVIVSLRPPMPHTIATLQRADADLVFNLFEGFDGLSGTEWLFAEAIGRLGRPFTGASAETLALCLNKARTKQLLAAHGIPTPPFQLLSPESTDRFSLGFPVIVKPLQEDGSHGITALSLVGDVDSLVKQVTSIVAKYGSPALVESFLPGREFNVSVLGRRSPFVLPPSEAVYSPAMAGPRIQSYAAKWLTHDPAYQGMTPVCPAHVPEALRQEIQDLALAAHEAVGGPPYARIDLRADGQGRLHVLEVNPNPDLSPTAGLAVQAEAAGLAYVDLIETIMDMALEVKSVGERQAAPYAT